MNDSRLQSSSESGMASHIPSRPRTQGRSRMAPTCKSMVLEKDMAALTLPLFRAVKKAEAKIL